MNDLRFIEVQAEFDLNGALMGTLFVHLCDMILSRLVRMPISALGMQGS